MDARKMPRTVAESPNIVVQIVAAKATLAQKQAWRKFWQKIISDVEHKK